MPKVENLSDNLGKIDWCSLVSGGCPWKPSTNQCGVQEYLSHYYGERRKSEAFRLYILANGSPQEQQEFIQICGRGAGLIGSRF